ncbi:hypothetical protein [Arthrobacter pigmenti]
MTRDDQSATIQDTLTTSQFERLLKLLFQDSATTNTQVGGE